MHGEGHSFHWLNFVPGLNTLPVHVAMLLIVAMALILFGLLARIQLAFAMKNQATGLIPEAKLSVRNIFEMGAEYVYNFTQNTIGKEEAKHHFPLIGAIFVFIFISNVVGLFPGLSSPSDNLNTTLALGTVVFFYYNIVGFKVNGLGYIKHFMGPVWWLAPLLFCIELASHLIRPISLAFRLRGNIMGDHIVLGVFSDLTPYVVPVIFYGMGLFVCFIQAFVFSLMTMVYISLASSHDH